MGLMGLEWIFQMIELFRGTFGVFVVWEILCRF